MARYILKDGENYFHAYYYDHDLILDNNINPKYIEWYKSKYAAILFALKCNHANDLLNLQVIDRDNLEVVDNSFYEEIFNFQKNNMNENIMRKISDFDQDEKIFSEKRFLAMIMTDRFGTLKYDRMLFLGKSLFQNFILKLLPSPINNCLEYFTTDDELALIQFKLCCEYPTLTIDQEKYHG